LVSELIVTWQLDLPEEVLLLEVVSVSCHEDVISSVFSEIQGDCKVTAEIGLEQRQKDIK
jgi:hypothetical protein